MQVNILSDEEMRKIGFTDRVISSWYYCVGVGETVTFNLTVNKADGSFEIDVLDENFLQPYDYQYILRKIPNHEFASTVRNNVEKQLLYLCSHNIFNDFDYNIYL
jgi:hypothetical protein